MAIALEEAGPRGYYPELRRMYQAKRDFLVGALRDSGFFVYVPEGTYFVLADFRAWGFDDDVEFCRSLTAEAGVAAIPPSSFYCEADRGLARTLARFCFCKSEETLEEAARRLRLAYGRLAVGR